MHRRSVMTWRRGHLRGAERFRRRKDKTNFKMQKNSTIKPPKEMRSPRTFSGAGKRTAASGVAWSGCASLRGPLCAGEALLEARTQASVALFKLGAHSAAPRPEFGWLQPKLY